MKNTYTINLDGYNKNLAMTCRSGISFDPEKRGEQQIASTTTYLNECKEELFKLIKNESEIEIYTSTMDYFIKKYLEELNDMNGAQSRTLSPMITGPANFKATTKANDSYIKKLDILCERFEKSKKYLIKQLKRIRTQEAGGELAQKKQELEKLQKFQDDMKAINKICGSIKKTNEQKIIECKELNISESVVNEIKTYLGNDFEKVKIFAGYSLTNNNAKIKARQQYIARQEKIANRIEEAGAVSTLGTYKGGEIVQDLEAQRINILFEGKPEREIIDAVKAYGFKWSWKCKVWTRKLTNNTLYNVKRMLEVN